MAAAATTRRLTCILIADVVSYSRLMAEDEAATVAQLRANRAELIKPKLDEYHGKTLKLMGDGALIEFPSVVDAVSFAIDIQQAIKRRNLDIPAERQISYRIGISSGDLVEDDEDIYGEGINIAARLQTMCKPDGIYVTQEAFQQARGRVVAEFKALGNQHLKNIPDPVPVYSVIPGIPEQASTSAEKSFFGSGLFWLVLVAALLILTLVATRLYFQPSLSLPGTSPAVSTSETGNTRAGEVISRNESKISLAVIPFNNMSDDPQQEYFSDGVSEDIMTDLSKLSNLAVIARNSSVTYKGSSASAQQIGQELGAGYLLQGSIRKHQNRIRINAQLVETGNGHQLWAERYDGDLTDVFELQDNITEQIVAALSLQLSRDEEAQLSARTTTSFEAYDLYLQAHALANNNSRKSGAQATTMFRRVIELDPGFARAYGSLSTHLLREIIRGYSDSPSLDAERAYSMAKTAVSIDPNSPHALWALGYAHLQRREFDEAITIMQHVIELAPSYADGFGLLALINNNIGNAQEAIKYANKGIELNPFYTWDYPYNLGRAHFVLGDFEIAKTYLQQARERNPSIPQIMTYLAATYVRLNEIDEAEWIVADLNIQHPEITLSHLQKTMAMAKPELKRQLLADLRTAGMPE